MNRKSFTLPPADGELARLVEAMCDGAITAAERDRLESLLAADRDAMLYYVAFFDMHAEVQWLMRDEDAEVASKARTDDPAAWAKSEHEDETSDNWGDRPTVADDLLSLPPIVVDVSPRRESLFSGLFTPGGFVFSYGASAVLLLIALLIGWSLKISHDNRAEHTASGPRPSASPIQANAAPAIVGRITDMVDCRWSNSKTEAIRREVALGQGFSLSTGLLEITYDTGAKVILQGPCAYRINSACGGFLALGRLTARVEKKAAIKEGSGNIHHSSSIKRHSPNPLFAVQTPTATVTDLGTEFGVEVSAEGRTDARVFEGAIRVATEAGKGDRRQDRICRQGEAVRVVPGKSAIRVIGEKEASGAGYSRAMPARASAVECRSYAQMVLSLRPVIYYRMERPVGRVDPRLALDSAPGAHHGQLHVASDIFGGSPYRMGRFGDSLDYRSCRGMSVSDYPVIAGSRISASLWVMVTGPDYYSAFASNWGAKDGTQFMLGLLDGDGRLAARVAQPAGGLVEIRDAAMFPLSVWSHVAVVADNDGVRLYRDGRRVAVGRFGGASASPAVAAKQAAGKTAPPTAKEQHNGPIEIRIDEFAVFSQSLSDEMIRQLYHGGPQRSDMPGSTRKK